MAWMPKTFTVEHHGEPKTCVVNMSYCVEMFAVTRHHEAEHTVGIAEKE